MTKDIFSVSEFAQYTGLSIRTLHYYEEKGILHPLRDKDTGHRRYVKEDLLQLHQIVTLKFLGFTLEEIKDITMSTSVDLSFIETLRLQEAKLVEDKEKIEVSLEMIKRTVKLIEDEKQIDKDMLVSLLASMQTEKQQKEISKGILSDQAIDQLFRATDSEKLLWEKEILRFYKETKRLVGRSSDDPEVMKLFQRFFTYVLDIFKMEGFHELENILKSKKAEDISDEELDRFILEMEKLVPNPLTKEEVQWLDGIMTTYMTENSDFWKGVVRNGKRST
ncbi:transcriptional activator of multidrug-efflux transporter [Oceanobacillus iheyensis HTE831]|uniref:Transcriptional activator of multidrug-efflux transporter n=1 Tax=Oceanobacillus iheyensis (strain DSM 14371 / CIP 107618 / JCM 11309 / KCTC 3954 / HTE831) TaxID=221109 RepID=Q8ET39_OCEIH|nr:MerR family transcriptional regulator [Oceanobacillus iheyensis]BAC12381.1 transcriptional activator of multidrug-efflux transporter [Oceanobacillus iheyensis HTE831]